jgi:hypothetical protein
MVPKSVRNLSVQGRRRIAYSREFLLSVGTSSEACRKPPAGFDASKLRYNFPCWCFSRLFIVFSSFAADVGLIDVEGDSESQMNVFGFEQ